MDNRHIANRFSEFSEKFFERPIAAADQPDVDFPLPNQHHELLSSFFQSDEGMLFKVGARKILQQLSAWADEQQINSHILMTFDDRYLNYSGNDIEINETYLQLYIEGIPALANIANLLANPAIHLTAKQDTISKLLQGLDECGPGTHSNIMDAHLSLTAQLNLPMALMRARKQLAEQAALNLMKKIANIHPIEEVHYVNAILNHFAAYLNIQPVIDVNIDLCDTSILHELFGYFSDIADQTMTLENVLSALLSAIDYQSLPEKMSQPNNMAVMREFNQQLNFFGMEAGTPLYYDNDMIEASDDGLSFRSNWRAPYVLRLSLMQRLKASGFLNVECSTIKFQQDTIYYMPGSTLKLSYVQVTNDPEHKEMRPFLTYCVQAIVNKNKRIIPFIVSSKLSDAGRMEIGTAICEFYSSLSETEQQASLLNLSTAIQKFLNLDKILALPKCEFIQSYLATIDKNILKNYAIYQWTFLNIVTTMTNTDAATFIFYLHTNKLYSIGGKSLLSYAAALGNVQAVQLLVDNYQNNSQTQTMINEAFRITCKEGNLDVLRLLLKYVIRYSLQSRYLDKALYYSVDSGHLDLVLELLDHGADLEASPYGVSVLSLAIRIKKYTIAAELIYRGAEIGYHFFPSLLHEIAFRGDLKLAETVIEKAPLATIEYYDTHGETPLCLAVDQGHMGVAIMLLDKGADIHHCNLDDESPLLYAVTNRDPEMILLLLSYGADPHDNDPPNNGYKTAINKHYPEIIRAFDSHRLYCSVNANTNSLARTNAYARFTRHAIYNEHNYARLTTTFAAFNHFELTRHYPPDNLDQRNRRDNFYQYLDHIYQHYSETGSIDLAMLLTLHEQTTMLVSRFNRDNQNCITGSLYSLFNLDSSVPNNELSSKLIDAARELKECIALYQPTQPVAQNEEAGMERDAKRMKP